MSFNITYLPGDGVGPEVALAARKVAEAAAEKFALVIAFHEFAFGGAAIDAHGDPFPPMTRRACAEADAIFLGAVGGPKWEGGAVRPEAGLLDLRKALGLYANLRPIRIMAGMEVLSPLKVERARDVDILFVRELTGGIYFGKRVEGNEHASDECAYSREEVERVARVAFEAARARKGRLASVDKANVLATSRLWRAVVSELHERDYNGVELSHVLVDAMAMKLIERPAAFDVVLTENMFGDILSDEASVITGSIGLAPSASLGGAKAGLYEPIHGSAPDIAGQDKANPVGAILSAAMMFRHSFDAEAPAKAIEDAVKAVLAAGFGTADIGGNDGCAAFSNRVAAHLAA